MSLKVHFESISRHKLVRINTRTDRPLCS